VDGLAILQQYDSKIAAFGFLYSLPFPDTAIALYANRIGILYRCFNPSVANRQPI